jgi:predicted translin family RNA/ssDNA-binding protein
MLDIHRELRELCERQGEALKKLAAERDEARVLAGDLSAQLAAAFQSMQRINTEAARYRLALTAMAEELKRAPRGNAVHRALMIAREALEGGQTWPEANERGPQ